MAPLILALIQLQTLFMSTFQPDVSSIGAQLTIEVMPGPLGANPLSHEIIETDAGVVRRIRISQGLVSLPDVTPDGLALFICHELGHVLGGAPYISTPDTQFLNPILNNVPPARLISVEGQADYFATRDCLPKILAKLPQTEPSYVNSPEEEAFIENKCKSNRICRRGWSAIREFAILMEIVKEMKKAPDDRDQSPLVIWTRDTREADFVNRTPMFYPQPECRIETLGNGWQKKERPSCWFVQ